MTTKTAREAYQKQATLARALIGQLQETLQDHANHQRYHPDHWGFAGDLSHINDQLLNVVMFMLPETHKAKKLWVEDETAGAAKLTEALLRAAL